ncbi:Putative mercuric reductase protein [Fulvimarina pelagi HTCC2506]|uniref:Putative mercuric reductase protein n=1 Tax=Fulvimarina pelagi HTCC2506 TaxID=314231 RepID=Q0G0T5_9HYPH|nr:FAD-dependent oxidoreductase [Fulvimarina pelagi]EAU40904.1 Putative mercuric reductase protein [Fulvimarina pelagi HTCC2506]
MASDTDKPDICVIGAGSGGLTVAAASAAFGVSVMLIERDKMGGDCLNYGCVPSKALIAAGKTAQTFRKAERFGVTSTEPQIDFAAVNRHVRDVIGAIAPNDSVERFEGLGVDVVKGDARFLDGETLEVNGRRIKARRFVVATGSRPFVPPITGLKETPHLTNETLFDLTDCPKHLIVIGGGPIGMEMAQAHRRLGADVTVIEGAKPLGKDDPELAEVVLKRLAEEGIRIEVEAKVVDVGGSPGAINVTAERGGERFTVSGSHLLVAVGRQPNVEGLGLEAAGIDFARSGITVGKDLRTTNKRVYAVGDVAGGPQFTHVAGYHGGLVLRPLLFRLPIKTKHEQIPHVTYTDPELGQVGPTEVEARDAGQDVTTVSWPYAENDRAQTERETEGLIKIVVGKRGKIVGAGVAGAKAGEMTNLLALAVAQGMKLSDLQGFVSPYPTLSEIAKRAATSYYSSYTTKPIVRSAIAFLRRFG